MKILVNLDSLCICWNVGFVQQHTEELYTMIQWDFSQESKIGSTYENQPV